MTAEHLPDADATLAERVRAGLAALGDTDLAAHPELFTALDAAIRDELRDLADAAAAAERRPEAGEPGTGAGTERPPAGSTPPGGDARGDQPPGPEAGNLPQRAGGEPGPEPGPGDLPQRARGEPGAEPGPGDLPQRARGEPGAGAQRGTPVGR